MTFLDMDTPLWSWKNEGMCDAKTILPYTVRDNSLITAKNAELLHKGNASLCSRTWCNYFMSLCLKIAFASIVCLRAGHLAKRSPESVWRIKPMQMRPGKQSEVFFKERCCIYRIHHLGWLSQTKLLGFPLWLQGRKKKHVTRSH